MLALYRIGRFVLAAGNRNTLKTNGKCRVAVAATGHTQNILATQLPSQSPITPHPQMRRRLPLIAR
jgi:hypothetical protein